MEKNLRKFTLRSLKQIFTANPLNLTLTRTESSNIYIYIHNYTQTFLARNIYRPKLSQLQFFFTSFLAQKNYQKIIATRSLHDTSQGICCCHVSVAELVSIASTFGTVTSTGGAVLRVIAKKLLGDDTHNSPFHQDLKPREMQSFWGSHHHRHLFHQGLSCPRSPGCRAK